MAARGSQGMGVLHVGPVLTEFPLTGSEGVASPYSRAGPAECLVLLGR